jgi:hypothetical protein
VPEPRTFALIAAGLLLLLTQCRRRVNANGRASGRARSRRSTTLRVFRTPH